MAKNEFSENEVPSVQSVTEFNSAENEFNPTEGESSSSSSSSAYSISKTSIMDVTKVFLASFLVAGTVTLTWGCSSDDEDSSGEENASSITTKAKEINIPSYFEKEYEAKEVDLSEAMTIYLEAKI